MATYEKHDEIIPAEEFLDALAGNYEKLGLTEDFEEVRLTECVIEGRVDISEAGIEPDKNQKYPINKIVRCWGCTFKDKVDFGDTTFSRAYFSNATFSGEASFRDATFSESAYFSSATFSGETYFRDATFSGEASFRDATFSRASFSSANFSGEASFSSATFSRASFSSATFSGEASFSSATFSESASFSSATFSGETYFISATFSRADFISATFSRASFSSATFSGEAYFNFATFSRADFNFATFSGDAHFSGTEFNIPANFIVVRYKPNKFFQFQRQKPTQFYLDSQHIDEVSNPSFKRYVADQQFIRDFRRNHRFWAFIWRWSSDYGRSLGLWAFWSVLFSLFFACIYANDFFPMLLSFGGLYTAVIIGIVLNESSLRVRLVFTALLIVVIVFFAFKYTPEFRVSGTEETSNLFVRLLGLDNENHFRDAPEFITFLYFSVVTFTTLGFGDITPFNHAAEVWVMAEVILGYVMLGGLISIFANKLARRS